MSEISNFLIGIVFLLAGIPLGNFLARVTKEELKTGQKWFKLIVLAGFIGAVIALILRSDVLLFSFLFIAIVTSRSLRQDKR